MMYTLEGIPPSIFAVFGGAGSPMGSSSLGETWRPKGGGQSEKCMEFFSCLEEYIRGL